MTPLLRGFIASLIVVAICVGVWWIWTGGNNPASLGEAPTAELDRLERQGVRPFHLPMLAGGEFDLASAKNPVILINFWASWCDPCVREFPSLLKLAQRMKGQLLLLAVSQDETKADVERFVQAFGGEHENVVVLLDPERRLAEEFGTRKLPESYILDRRHRLVRKVVGVETWDNEDASSFFHDVAEGLIHK